MAAILLLALHLAVSAATKCSTGFSVVAPEVAVPGKTTAVLVTLHGRKGENLDPLNVTVRLETQDEDNAIKLLTTASQMISDNGIIQLKVPSSSASHCTLHTSVGCDGDEECTSRSHSIIRLLGRVRDVIVRPARHHYRPGETITFWLLALDHDLRLMRKETANVALLDPSGTKVAIWNQLSLEEGVRKLSTTLARGARSGTWRIEAECGGGIALVDVDVGGGIGTPAPSAPAAEQHYVELRFAGSMRRRYKPGLPFVGRVEAVSTERRVRVRVKLYDNQTDIYSQDIDMSSGEGAFVVPTVMADSPYINLQAELVAVEGKEIETHYVLAKERIRKWNSTSKCYLLVENLPTPLQAGGVASASVWSSCGCRRRLLAAVTSGGRAVHWAAIPPVHPANNSDLCRFNYTFPVSADMAPVSSLLVYYVTENGEPISDVAEFYVRLLHKEVSVSVEQRRWWYPRASLALRVLAPPHATVCLLGARAPLDARLVARATDEEHTQPGPEFVSAGVSLFVGGAGCGGGVIYRQRPTPSPPRPAPLVPPADHDRLWMWKCFNYTAQLSTDGVTIAAPSEAGRWSLWALSLSPRGLRFSSPKTINVFRPLQLDFNLPPALKVGEMVEVDVKITNNINNCMDVTALLALSAGAAFASTGALYVTERLRLGPRGGTQLVVRVAVNTPGRKNITVEVTGYSADNCSVSYTSFNNETLVGSVIRSASVLVLPEGLHRSDTQSAYFCANEHLAVSSRGSWEWQWVAAPRNRAGLVLELRSQGAAHVALSAIQEASDDMYRVVFERTRVWIAKGRHGYDVHLASAEQTEADEECPGDKGWCAWWVWWEGGRLSVGRGAAPSERRLLVWPLAQDTRIKFVGFSAMWGDKADFRIWNFNEEAGFSQVLELGLPHGVVPGSASGTLLISGGLHLPLYSFQTDASDQWPEVWRDSQLSAASAYVAPLLALEFIPHLVEEGERERILKKLPEQVQILLAFRKSDNSFSDHPSISSHMSTIKMLEILSKIQSYYPIDPELLQSIKKWVQKRQNSDGSFTPLPADEEVDYFPVELKNGTENLDVNEYYYYDKDGNMTDAEIEWERRVEVTAETLVALLEVGVENQVDANTVTKAQTYLEKNFRNVTSPAALAATVLALVLARSPVVPEALTILRNASTTEEGEFGWPTPRKDAADWLLEDTSKNIRTTSYEAVTMEQYVAGVRVLLAACARGALAEGEAAARFLYYRASTLQRHPSLTYIATKAAAQYAALAHDRHRALTVSLATAGMELTDTLELRAKTPARLLPLPGLPTKAFVYATGAGCATVQGTITYSTYKPKPENALLNIQAAIIEEIRPERSSIEDLQGNLPTLIIKTCFKWKGKERSGILRLEASLFSGYELSSVNPVVLDGATFADLHYGSRGESVWFVFANISSTCPICVTYEARSKFIITSLRPAFAKIYPSTRPDLAVETFFHARPNSPLLRSITDDDFITWFDKTELASLKTAASIDNICECGRICSRDYEFRKQNSNNTTGIKIAVKSQIDYKPTMGIDNTTFNSIKYNVTPTPDTSVGHETVTITKLVSLDDDIEIVRPTKITAKINASDAQTTSEIISNIGSTMSPRVEHTTDSISLTTKQAKNILNASLIHDQVSIKQMVNQLTTIKKSDQYNPAIEHSAQNQNMNEKLVSVKDVFTTKSTLQTFINISDDPIIIPTVTYVNHTKDEKTTDNSVPLIPKPDGELIVQKSMMAPSPKLQNVVNRKSLPRRKGTLKATYGDNHDKFFEKVKSMSTEIYPTFSTEMHLKKKYIITKSDIKGNSDIENKLINKQTKTLVDKKGTKKISTVVNSEKSKVLTQNENIIKTVKTSKAVKGETINHTETKNKGNPKKEVHDVTSPKVNIHNESLGIPHTITSITNKNIKSILYRTKKPKAKNQIMKPIIHFSHNVTDNSDKINHNKNGNLDMDKLNPFGGLTFEIHNKHFGENSAKTIKSINKEIHKVSPTPISETSEKLSEITNIDIGPEKKAKFNIKNKNNLWELLKEGPEVDSDRAKVADKILHNSLLQAQNVSNNDSRSL